MGIQMASNNTKQKQKPKELEIMQSQINFSLAKRPKLGSPCGFKMWAYRVDCKVLQVVDVC